MYRKNIFSAVILHEQVNYRKTVIEKIEAHTNVGFAIVLYTPCDTGSLAGEHTRKSRARQNVVFENGYLKLGCHNACALVTGDIEIPNDISGVALITF
ncbi:TIR domain-containing protein [Superficieibacter sp. 1612_C1]|uniref:TIR domain-containing protein n=1 Tax=Superficieibacter sp. 1612_C1 TaxID=2780382 RepID=UPI00351BA388